MHAREAVGEYATLEKAQELSSNEAREPRAAERVELREKGLGVLFQKAIEQRLRRVAATVTSDASFAGRRRHSAWTGTRRRWLQPVSAAPRMSLTVLGRQGEIAGSIAARVTPPNFPATKKEDPAGKGRVLSCDW